MKDNWIKAESEYRNINYIIYQRSQFKIIIIGRILKTFKSLEFFSAREKSIKSRDAESTLLFTR